MSEGLKNNIQDFRPESRGTMTSPIRSYRDVEKQLVSSREASALKMAEERKAEELVKNTEIKMRTDALNEEENRKLFNDARIIRDMTEEQQQKLQVPMEDVENLVGTITVQRNNALTRVAVEQARVKSLMKIIEQQKIELDKKNMEINDLKSSINSLTGEVLNNA